MLKADKQQWEQATANLRARGERGTVGESVEAKYIRDYKKHLSKVYVGYSVLDVGCGSQFLKECLPPSVAYTGIDAFPINDSIVKAVIEEMTDERIKYDTVCAFAVLDNCYNFDLSIENMKRIANKNIVILTGVDIEVDKFHTFKLTLNDFDTRFSDWQQGYRELLAPKVWLLEYIKP